MGLLEFLKKLLGRSGRQLKSGPTGTERGHLDVGALAHRLGMTIDELCAVEPSYHQYQVPKRSGGMRPIAAPDVALKKVQRLILRRLLARLGCHESARGFERGQSIVTNALPHAEAAVVIRMDVENFFGSTSARRVKEYFLAIGYDRQSADLLVRLCTFQGGLPQGAPTSPRLSNLLNQRLDARLSALARKLGGAYTRYADDLTFSLPKDDRPSIQAVLRITKLAAADEGYRLHQKRKLQIRRRHERQQVTGLVVNSSVNLPRRTRHWLRAVEHRLTLGRQTTLRADQLTGWQALRAMVAAQAAPQKGADPVS